MSKKIDMQKSARLVVEAYILTELVYSRYRRAMYVDIPGNKAQRVYKKLRQRVRRRKAQFDTIIATQLQPPIEMYVEHWRGNVPTVDHTQVITNAGNVIYFDIQELENSQS